MVLYAFMYCVCVFLLRREFSDMTFRDKPLISEVVLSQNVVFPLPFKKGNPATICHSHAQVYLNTKKLN
jgi:hypothetical protein